ncbi:MAG: 2-succinyl-5-enolpyruvyl-6-hydroxy-3-cyclohexene-1-carboxylic-acid synthase [Chlorobium sp.]
MSYSDNQSVQILISLLKEFKVRHAVLSPGSRNVPVVHSLEKDPDFSCYSIVDERSAAYFGLGLALETGEPVLISCTSGTATTNYTSAMWEASKQNLPLIALTSDRNQYFLGQLEDQMIVQPNMYGAACRKSVTLPIVKDEQDAWYCRRLVNEALLALRHRDGGPVQINLPTEWGLFAQNFNTPELPKVRPFHRFTRRDMASGPISALDEIRSKKRILVLVGQGRAVSEEYQRSIEEFFRKYPCAIAIETISNLHMDGAINTSLISRSLSKEMFLEYAPDLVISVGRNYVSTVKGLLKGCASDFEHWTINEDGAVVDQFRKLTAIFECSPDEFFAYMSLHAEDGDPDRSYLNFWQSRIGSLPKPVFPYSSNYIMQEFLQRLPEGSILHYGNGVAVHVAQYFASHPSIVTYCHSGTTTIDGSLSTFIGQASVSKRLCFALIGDLSFFYDMNAIWNRYVDSNVRILLYNNEGGGTFHWNNARDIDTLPLHTSAEHFATAKGWVESLGFKYLSARTKEEFDRQLPEFLATDLELPVCFEVFTKKDLDGKSLHEYYDQCRQHLLDSNDLPKDENS